MHVSLLQQITSTSAAKTHNARLSEDGKLLTATPSPPTLRRCLRTSLHKITLCAYCLRHFRRVYVEVTPSPGPALKRSIALIAGAYEATVRSGYSDSRATVGCSVTGTALSLGSSRAFSSIKSSLISSRDDSASLAASLAAGDKNQAAIIPESVAKTPAPVAIKNTASKRPSELIGNRSP